MKAVDCLVISALSCLLLTPSSGFTTGLLHTMAAQKRSSFNLAFYQIYDLCDSDRNGRFTLNEFRCVDDLVHIYFGRR